MRLYDIKETALKLGISVRGVYYHYWQGHLVPDAVKPIRFSRQTLSKFLMEKDYYRCGHARSAQNTYYSIRSNGAMEKECRECNAFRVKKRLDRINPNRKRRNGKLSKIKRKF